METVGFFFTRKKIRCTFSKTYDKLQIDIRHTAILMFSKNDTRIVFVQITFQAENGCKQEYFPFHNRTRES